MVQSGSQCTMTSLTTPARVRLTITVTPEVHVAFHRLSKASGMSIGRAMGEWLGDTLDAVEFTAAKVEEARSSPKLVMQEMHAYAMGLVDETNAMILSMRGKGSAVREKGVPSRTVPLDPPSSNTGGKVPRVNPKTGAKR